MRIANVLAKKQRKVMKIVRQHNGGHSEYDILIDCQVNITFCDGTEPTFESDKWREIDASSVCYLVDDRIW